MGQRFLAVFGVFSLKKTDPRKFFRGSVGLGRYNTLLCNPKEGCHSVTFGTTIVHTHHLLRFEMAKLKDISIESTFDKHG